MKESVTEGKGVYLGTVIRKFNSMGKIWGNNKCVAMAQPHRFCRMTRLFMENFATGYKTDLEIIVMVHLLGNITALQFVDVKVPACRLKIIQSD